VHVDLVSDRSISIRASVSDVAFTLAVALALVVMVIFLFLRKFWATVIPSITLPVVIVETFAATYMLGQSIDNLSLMALTIAIGFLVDDAIVMIENIVRHIEVGKPPLQAALDGAGHRACLQRFRPIMMTTVCALIVALPLAVETGAGAELRRPMGIAIVGGLLVSQWLTLYTTPVVYLYLDRLNTWMSRPRLPSWPWAPRPV
jgi:multidrug efflux pump subunit AcrB